jgi:hypothetical protein
MPILTGKDLSVTVRLPTGERVQVIPYIIETGRIEMSEQKIIPPTVGRKVWLELNGATSIPRFTSDGIIASVGQPIDATITAVWGDRMINIAGFDAHGAPYTLHSITLLQPGDPIPDYGRIYAQWMPYQVGQAKA